MKKDFLSWLRAVKPDILCLQEIKALPEQFPKEAFEALGYHCYIHSAEKPGYSGVAILSLHKPLEHFSGMGIPKYDVEGRFQKLAFKDFNIINTYMPSGASKPERQVYKLEWLKDFKDVVTKESKHTIVCGDFNICHSSIDIHNPNISELTPGYTQVEKQWLTDFLELGYQDAFRVVCKEPGHYTWWSYMARARPKNLGWRIDYILVDNRISVKRAVHLSAAMHSDHCPVLTELDI